MIPRDYITGWRSHVPWIEDSQIEQDLVISKALVDIFSNDQLRQALAFRGGTALYKLYIKPAARYSEDIDLVQVTAEPAGAVMEALRATLDPWLGQPRYKQGHGSVTIVYRFASEAAPPLPLKLKVEINTREHFAVHGYVGVPFAVESRWFSGACSIKTYCLNELLATKLRALYQRRKGRDLFDLATALEHTEADPAQIIETHRVYMAHEGRQIPRKVFEENLSAKLHDPTFLADIRPLLASGYEWSLELMAETVMTKLIGRLPE
jgi:predicted nucleotidyltransferase component of viral defense system